VKRFQAQSLLWREVRDTFKSVVSGRSGAHKYLAGGPYRPEKAVGNDALPAREFWVGGSLGIISSTEYQNLAKPEKKHKHAQARRTKDKRGIECPSWLHAEVSNFHIDLEDAGDIKDYRREVAVRLTEKCKECGARAMVYKVDFVYEVVKPRDGYSVGETVYVEPKGVRDASFKRRERRWRKKGPGRLEIWFGMYHSGMCMPYLAETIHPKELTAP
jgi:hypothetical protein